MTLSLCHWTSKSRMRPRSVLQKKLQYIPNREPDFRNTFLKIDGFVEAPKDSGLVSFVCSVVQ